MKLRSVLLSLLCCVAATATATPQASRDSLTIPFQQYELPNGLRVILSVDHTTPTVGVTVWYHVGSKNEKPGRTGFAHFFEHVMFTGSEHVPYGLHDKYTEGIGGSNNGTTNEDRTMYFETVPSNYLETALWLESDRMGFLLETLDLDKMNAQRDIVKNERRQSVDNQPYGRVSEILSHAMYPPSHPYSWDVIGSMKDLSAATEQDVKDFFRLYYAPNNAILSIAGDFDIGRARQWVAEYFGGIPRGNAIERPDAAPVTLPAEARYIYEDRVPVSRLVMQWPTVGVRSGDDAPLSLLGSILSGSRTARLTKELVFETQAAAGVSARQSSNENAGAFGINVTPSEGHSLGELEAAVDDILARIKAEGPTEDEVDRARANREISFLRGLESNLSKSFVLADGAGFHNDPGHFSQEYTEIGRVTAGDVQRVAREYLTSGRIVMSVVPIGAWDQASHPSEGQRLSVTNEEIDVAPEMALDRDTVPPAGDKPTFQVPAWTRSTLSNGMDLIVIDRPGLPLVDFQIRFMGGDEQYEPFDKPGIASLTASMMMEGTGSLDGDALSEAQQRLGTSLGISVGGQAGSAGFTSTTANFKDALDLLVDVLVNPTFPTDALERQRARRLVSLRQALARTSVVAGRVFPKLLYGENHRLGRLITASSLETISREDLVSFHDTYFQPGRAIAVVSGDVSAAEVRATIDSALSSWPRGGSMPDFDYTRLPEKKPTTIYIVDQPNAAQSSFAIGNPGPSRDTDDFYAIDVMNTMLGGLFQSRLNANIREDKGYSYGVRSSFGFGRGPGAFRAGGDIVSAKTDSALIEFMKELRGITGTRPVTDEELETAQKALVQGLPDTFAGVTGVNRAVSTLWIEGLPDNYYQEYPSRIEAVTKDDVVRAAKKYIDLDHLTIVIVGDRATIEAPLKATGIAPVVVLDSRAQGASN